MWKKSGRQAEEVAEQVRIEQAQADAAAAADVMPWLLPKQGRKSPKDPCRG